MTLAVFSQWKFVHFSIAMKYLNEWGKSQKKLDTVSTKHRDVNVANHKGSVPRNTF